MIELRWLHQGSADERPTLQFRTWIIRIDASGSAAEWRDAKQDWDDNDY